MTDTQVKKELNVGDTIYLKEWERNQNYYYSTIVSRVTKCRAYATHPRYKGKEVCVNRLIGGNNRLSEIPKPSSRWDSSIWIVGEEAEKKYNSQVEEEKRQELIKNISEAIEGLTFDQLAQLQINIWSYGVKK